MHMSTNRVVVLLSDEELVRVKARAGMVPLSAWFRALALRDGGVAETVVASLKKRDVEQIADDMLRVRPHMIHSGTHPIKGCRECAALGG